MVRLDFISLVDTLNILAECVQLPPNPFATIPISSPAYIYWNAHYPNIVKENKLAEAASQIRDALRLSTAPPRWFHKNEAKQNPEEEGKGVLGYVIEVYKIRQRERQEHLKRCLADNIDPIKTPLFFSVDFPKWQPGNPVGFDRSELIEFLNKHDIEHEFSSSIRIYPVEIDNTPCETDEERVARLRKGEMTDDQIVFELIEGGMSPARAGKLVLPPIIHKEENPNNQQVRDAYRNRAKRAYEREQKRRGF